MRLNITKLVGYANCRDIAFMCNKSNAVCPGSMLKYIFSLQIFLYSVLRPFQAFSLISRRINRRWGENGSIPRKKN